MPWSNRLRAGTRLLLLSARRRAQGAGRGWSCGLRLASCGARGSALLSNNRVRASTRLSMPSARRMAQGAGRQWSCGLRLAPCGARGCALLSNNRLRASRRLLPARARRTAQGARRVWLAQSPGRTLCRCAQTLLAGHPDPKPNVLGRSPAGGDSFSVGWPGTRLSKLLKNPLPGNCSTSPSASTGPVRSGRRPPECKALAPLG